MGGATPVMPVIRARSQQADDTIVSGLIPSSGRYAVIGCKLQVPIHINIVRAQSFMKSAKRVQVS